MAELFSEYGEILEIVAKTNLKAKGQAFIVFDSVESAQKAIEEVQGFELFGKPMQLAFAKTRSDATVKRTGDEAEFESHKRRRLAEKGNAFPAPLTELVLIRPQTRRRQPKPLRRPRSSKLLRLHLETLRIRLPVRSRPSEALDCVRRMQPALRLFQTSTCHQTRFSLSKTCRRSTMRRL